jgi:hypothetical protein
VPSHKNASLFLANGVFFAPAYLKSIIYHYLDVSLDSLKTKLGAVIVDDNKEMAKNRVQQTLRGIPEEQIKEYVTYGTPEDVSRQIEILEQVGIQYLIVDLEPSRELEALDTFASKVINKMS